MRVLAESELYKITLHENGSNILIITFGGMHSDKTDSGFGTGFCMKKGYDNLYVGQKRGSQYQALSVDVFYNYVVKLVSRYRKVYAYGSSLGGYCALYYGGSVNARIISAAPKNSSDPFFGKEKFSGLFNHKSLLEVKVSKHEPLLIYDPYRVEETSYISQVVKLAYKNVREVVVPFSGHKILNTMADCGVLSNFLVSYIESDIVDVPRMEINDLPIFYEQRGLMYYRERNFLLSEADLNKSIEMKPTPEALGFLLRIYIRQKRYADGFDLMSRICNVDGKALVPRALFDRFISMYLSDSYK